MKLIECVPNFSEGMNNEVISFWDVQHAFQNVNCTHNEVKFYFKKLQGEENA